MMIDIAELKIKRLRHKLSQLEGKDQFDFILKNAFIADHLDDDDNCLSIENLDRNYYCDYDYVTGIWCDYDVFPSPLIFVSHRDGTQTLWSL